MERHPGAGRFSFLRMRPMALCESGHGAATVSLAALFDGEAPAAGDPGIAVQDLADVIVAGGWPAQQGRDVADAALAARDYLEQVRDVDVSRVGGVRRDPERVGALLRALARNVATEVKASVLAVDAGGADGPLDQHIVADYLAALRRLLVIEWSGTQLR